MKGYLINMNKTIIGIAAGNHDASISVIKNNRLVYAGHSERYSKIKNDKYLNKEIIEDALSYIDGSVDIICFYERPWLKKSRQLYAGQYKSFFTNFYYKKCIKALKNQLNNIPKIKYIRHHKAHAAHAYLSPFDEAIVLVVDSIGEWDTISFWLYKDNDLTLLESIKYPFSLGLFYTALTQYVGLKPNEDEYILMGMSAFGNLEAAEYFKDKFKFDLTNYKRMYNYNFHKGVQEKLNNLNNIDIAAATQFLLEEMLRQLVKKIYDYQCMYNINNLVYSGGVALNCVANTNIFLKKFNNNIFIFPNPGDSGTSVGAALVENKQKVRFDSIYLGYKMKELEVNDINSIVDYLIQNKIVGLAHGRAEFGPRALGNRSLLADPRFDNIKDEVNKIKQREKFRPFAPVILEEKFNEYFETFGLKSSPYMQYTFKCKYPELFPSIIHVDHTSRIQTINKDQNKFLYLLLSNFYEKTNCPMLLNTSLNIKGKPILNDVNDAKQFESLYGVKIFYAT